MHFTNLIRMVHESYLSDDDYPYLPKHMMAPTLDQLANRTELLDQLAQALPLTEAAEILGPAYQTYLWQMCMQHANPRMHSDSAKSPALALPYAEVMIAANPTGDEGREIRAYCRTRLEPIDYAALLADYDWLARRPLRGRNYWIRELSGVDREPEETEYFVDHYTNEDRYRRTHYYLASAWTY